MTYSSAVLIDEISGEKSSGEAEEDSGDSFGLREVEQIGVIGEEDGIDSVPLRYVPLCDVYSATSPCVSSTSGGSKKVKPPPSHHHRNSLSHFNTGLDRLPEPKPRQLSSAVTGIESGDWVRLPVSKFYTRRAKLKSKVEKYEYSVSDVQQSSQTPRRATVAMHKRKLVGEAKKLGFDPGEGNSSDLAVNKRVKRNIVGSEAAVILGVHSRLVAESNNSGRPQTRGLLNSEKINLDNNKSNISKICGEMKKRKRKGNSGNEATDLAPHGSRKWVWLNISAADPTKFVGLRCKVFWPLDAEWFRGRINGYCFESGRHSVKYDDGDEEKLILLRERTKFLLSTEEMQQLKLKSRDKCLEGEGIDVDDMLVLAASLDNCQDLEPGDIIWAKLTGHAMWPALVSDEALVGQRKGLSKNSGEKSVLVQFFGTHDFARIKTKQIVSFLKGLLSSFHLKCRKPDFVQSLVEAKMYLSEHKLPDRMLMLRNGVEADSHTSSGNGDQFTGPTSSACWNKIYKRIRKLQEDGLEWNLESGVDMFGFSHPEILKLVKELVTTRHKGSKPVTCKYQEFSGYRPVDVKWKDLDKCNVCHTDEEYENNPFLQCDKCRMMVHALCYGELEPVGGVLWLCNLCRPGAPDVPPPCCLCPVTGGAMKPTTDGRWAHLACAIWIPETCFSDVKKMEPIDGLSRVSKDRWKLICSICCVAYGACIQCSNGNCRVAYHPLCARAAGFCVELEDEDADRLNLIHLDEDDDEKNQSIRLLSYCKRHRSKSHDGSAADERIRPKLLECSEYIPPLNSTGCARTEPYSYFGRRGRKEPEAMAAACLKRLYVENRPHVVGSGSLSTLFGLQSLRLLTTLDTCRSFSSMDEKYEYMKTTLRKRLVFGKSRIHGFGIFARHAHKAGDMVIEYTGEIVRPSVADRREHFVYNSLVGAGTYMFRIDDQHVVDATRAGSIAHLINHSCEPNCYSRVITTVNGDEHIIIFAKRDIKQWEELSYDYRFMAIDEQLACCCGFTRCRGVVNDTEAEERAIKLKVPRADLIDR